MRHLSSRLTVLSLWLTAVLVALGGCDSQSHWIGGTDVPKVVGLQLTYSKVEKIKRRISFGEFTFNGPIYDALERVRWTARSFEKDGWTVESISGSPDTATGIFTQPWSVPDMKRLAKLQIVASKTNGSAVLSITIEKVSEQQRDAAPDSK